MSASGNNIIKELAMEIFSTWNCSEIDEPTSN